LPENRFDQRSGVAGCHHIDIERSIACQNIPHRAADKVQVDTMKRSQSGEFPEDGETNAGKTLFESIRDVHGEWS
jgi:hypothetical protein